jgi:hypothetical protein
MEQMSDFVFGRLANTAGCGISTELPLRERPAVSSFAATCTIPSSANFMLTGEATGASFYQWDQIDLGSRDYNDLNVPRFRSWMRKFCICVILCFSYLFNT